MPDLTAALLDMPAAIPKDATNTFAGYDYASADSLFAAIRPGLAKNGLAVYQNEVESETFRTEGKDGKTVLWQRAVYDFGITPGGVAPEHPERMTQYCQVTGAQSSGAIRTYALKYYLRAKCLLATGETDVDAMPSEAPPSAPLSQPGKWTQNPETLEYALADSFPDKIAEQRALFLLLRKDMDADNAVDIYKANEAAINTMPPEGRKYLEKRFAALDQTGV